ncbi:MAG: hypothetical protein Q8P41_21850 [Pseudomonadota bacterium]|nr:hypothetical protein [Pseudomonadota bacterium]
MLLGFLALTACGGGAFSTAVETTDAEADQTEVGPAPSAVETLVVDVTARVVRPGAPAAWTARASWGSPPTLPALAPGQCRRPAAELSASAPGAEAIEVSGAAGARLAWARATGTWGTVGPRQVLDAAWSVADVSWTDLAGQRHLAADVVRFGGLPEVTRVVREREGGVRVGWDPTTVGATELRVSGPAGALVCGTAPDGTTLPWWVVPAYQGEIVLESVRENSALVDGVLVRVRTTLERVIRLDEPAGITAEEKPPAFRPYSPQGPRRLVRPARHPVG